MTDDQLASLVRENLGLAADKPVENLTRNGCVEWDSLRHVKLMLAVQAAFHVRFSGAEMLKVASVVDLRAALAGKRK